MLKYTFEMISKRNKKGIKIVIIIKTLMAIIVVVQELDKSLRILLLREDGNQSSHS